MIDIHTHLLPGVDDGSPSLEVSLPILERFVSEGVEVVVCTPHLEASRASRAPHEEYETIFRGLEGRAPAGVTLLRGWEIMIDVPEIDLEDRRLGLGGSKAVLVEFPRMNVPAAAGREIMRLRTSGVIPVLAHPERYWGCTPDLVRHWRDAGAAIQMDASMLLGGPNTSRLARALLEEGLVDCIASDNHGDRRSLAGARTWLTEIGATEQADMLTRANARRMLDGEAPLPVAPLPAVERGMLSRLKQLVLGRS
ncbi:MAG: tyrosine-protein phosphatase [Gemmatimonadaceae bacterium]